MKGLAEQIPRNTFFYAVGKHIVLLIRSIIESFFGSCRSSLPLKHILRLHPNRKQDDADLQNHYRQLVGAALMVFVKPDTLAKIKNVEGSVKKVILATQIWLEDFLC